MRVLIMLFALLLASAAVYSQMQSAVWMYCYEPPQGGLNFTLGNADTFSVHSKLNITTANASVCNKNGKLLFYSNGIFIANSEYDTLKNSFGFNPGYGTDYWSQFDEGLDYAQSILILPILGDTNLFHVFSTSYEIVTFDSFWDENPLSLRYSKVDMQLDSGKGELITKAKIVLPDTLNTGRLTATRHANGRDWWVICHEYRTAKYYILLATKDSIYPAKEQEIGDSLIYDAWGQNCFSPDGRKFVNVDPIYQDSVFDYMEFDRCKGEFFNHQNLHTPGCQPQSGAFSRSGRFLYVPCTGHLYQFDTWAADIQESRLLAGTLSVQNNSNLLNNMMLAPDDKIYMATWSSYKFMHIIDSPDSLGVLCNFIEDGLALPCYNGLKGIPNEVNYDLGSLLGSPCDTLFNNSPVITQDFQIKLLPNPASSLLNIEYQSNEVLQFKLLDVTGVLKKEIALYPYFRNRMLHVEDLADGIYLAVVTKNGEQVWSEKLVIQHY